MARRRAVSAEDLDEIVAEMAAQQQVILMALRRIAALTRAGGRDPAEVRAHWHEDGHAAMDEATFLVAPGHEEIVRGIAKGRLDAIIEIGLR